MAHRKKRTNRKSRTLKQRKARYAALLRKGPRRRRRGYHRRVYTAAEIRAAGTKVADLDFEYRQAKKRYHQLGEALFRAKSED